MQLCYPPPPEFYEAAGQFNRNEFWECHETLEHLWLHAPQPTKLFLQGIIQVAAGLVHVQKVNFKGAVSRLGAGLEKLHRVEAEPDFNAIMNLSQFIQQADAALCEVERLGPENLHKFCPGHFPEFIPTSDGETC